MAQFNPQQAQTLAIFETLLEDIRLAGKLETLVELGIASEEQEAEFNRKLTLANKKAHSFRQTLRNLFGL